MSYTRNMIQHIIQRTPNEAEFHQAMEEVFGSLAPIIDKYKQYQESGLLLRMAFPERIITFRVPWVADSGHVQVNMAYRVQFSNVIGPYKGGMRFHPTVNTSILKFLGFEQTFKNALTGLPMGGGKGGSDFDPKGKSDGEVMRFCQSLMNEMYKYLGPNEDVPAGDIGVGAREIGYMFGQYKKLKGEFHGVITGKGIAYGGSLGRPEATGFGLVYLLERILKNSGNDIEGKKITISGSGNVAIFAAQKAMELGGIVVCMSDSGGYVYDGQGIDLNLIKYIKLTARGRISDYAAQRGGAVYTEGRGIWSVPVDIALPCATQNELLEDDAKLLVHNGCIAVCEGANMPCDKAAVDVFIESGIHYAPGKAANAGGVSVSGMEMSQNAMHQRWTFEEVDRRLHGVMNSIFDKMNDAAEEYKQPGNYLIGANIAGFKTVAEAMMAQGVV